MWMAMGNGEGCVGERAIGKYCKSGRSSVFNTPYSVKLKYHKTIILLYYIVVRWLGAVGSQALWLALWFFDNFISFALCEVPILTVP